MKQLLLAALLVGCSSPAERSLPPQGVAPDATVEIDSDFSPNEASAIIGGIAMWESSDSRIRLTFVVASHADVVAHGNDLNRNGYFVVRVSENAPGSCPVASWPAPKDLAITATTTGHAATCTIPSIPRVFGDALQVASAHEFGHALGLGHIDTRPSLMRTFLDEDAPFPLPEDVAALGGDKR